MDKRVDQVENKITKLENLEPLGLSTAEIRDMIDSRVEVGIDEYRERESRKNNLIMHNIPEPQSDSVEDRKQEDIDFITSMATELRIEELEVKSMIRLGEKTNKPRLAKVTVGTVVQKRSFLQKSKLLRDASDTGLRNVYVTPDLSRRARKQSKDLRTQLKFRLDSGEEGLTIRRGKIIKRNKVPRDEGGEMENDPFQDPAQGGQGHQ